MEKDVFVCIVLWYVIFRDLEGVREMRRVADTLGVRFEWFLQPNQNAYRGEEDINGVGVF